MITDKEIQEAVKTSYSFSEAMRKVGRKPQGASLQFFKKRIIKLGFDTSHFLGRAAHAGKHQTGKAKKRNWNEILVFNPNGREKSQVLRRAYKEYCYQNGISEICNQCKQEPFWNKKPLMLQIHHIDEINGNNIPENLTWMCPNCHTQEHF